jgi:hypothetical protein
MLLGMQHVLFSWLLAVKILQFYAAPGDIFAGERALICYGAEEASSVRISPEVAKLSPALSRCIAVEPKQDTTYTLTVVGPGSEQLTKTLRIRVRPVPRPAPEIAAFTSSESRIKLGGMAKLCFRVENAESVRIEPPVQYLGASVSGCFVVAPDKTTTYTLVAAGTQGRTARRKVTVTLQ